MIIISFKKKRHFLPYYILQLEGNVKTLQTLVIDVGCSLDCLSHLKSVDFCAAYVPELQKTRCRIFLVTCMNIRR